MAMPRKSMATEAYTHMSAMERGSANMARGDFMMTQKCSALTLHTLLASSLITSIENLSTTV